MEGHFKDKRVIVTGGSGVIGRELLGMLSKAGANVLSVDRQPPVEQFLGVSHLQAELAEDDLSKLVGFQPQIIFHLAASFERSTESPEFWTTNWHDNTLTSHRLVDIATKLSGLEAFVFASSYLIYSPSLYLSHSFRKSVVRLKETDMVNPRNLCGGSKYYTERELDFLRETRPSALRTVYARIFRVYGRGSKDIISRWVRAALLGQDIEVYNEQNRFDYIFAKDVAEGLFRLAASPQRSVCVNLGFGRARSIRDVLNCLEASVPGFKSKVKAMKGINEPFEASCANLAKLKEYTGWTPPTSLEDGIRTVIEFEQKQGGREGTRV